MDKSIFYMDERITLAAFYTVITSFLIGFLALTQINKVKEDLDKLLLFLFGLFFIFLSFDEYFEIHEYANTVVKNTLQKGTAFSQLSEMSWIFPLFFFILLVFGVFVLLFIREKEKQIKIPLMLGVICYIVVLILEVVGGQTFGNDIYVWFVGAEEGFEMIGGSFFLLSVLNRQKS